MDWITWAKKNTDPDKVGFKPEALAGTVVIDLSYGSFAGLFASSLFSELGARVIRIEGKKSTFASGRRRPALTRDAATA